MRVRLEVECGGTSIECDEDHAGYEETLASLARTAWLVIATMSSHNAIPVNSMMFEFQSLLVEPLRRGDSKAGEPVWLPKWSSANDHPSSESDEPAS